MKDHSLCAADEKENWRLRLSHYSENQFPGMPDH